MLGAGSLVAPTRCFWELLLPVRNPVPSLPAPVTGGGTPLLPARPRTLCWALPSLRLLAQKGMETETPGSEAEFPPVLLHLQIKNNGANLLYLLPSSKKGLVDSD